MSNVFKRYEIKYLLTYEQFIEIQKIIEEHMSLDPYGISCIQSLYYDTSTNLLIRRSMDKPVYKEKLRLRSYGLSTDDKPVFLEIKKKNDGIVYKRRIELKENEANYFIYGYNNHASTQIAKEIAYFKMLYQDLRPSILLIYDRIAYGCETDLRVTFDQNIRYRTRSLDLSTSLDGTPLFKDKTVLMEIKASSAIPLWLVRYLSEHKIFKRSFSKYAEAYKKISNNQEENIWVISQNQSLQIHR